MNKNKTPIRSIVLPDGKKAELCCGQEATRILRACPDFFRRLLEQQVEATYEVPHLPFWRIRVGLRNLFGPLVEQLGRLFGSFDRRIGKPLLDFLYPPGWFFSPNKKKELEWMWDDAQTLLDQGNFALVIIGLPGITQCGLWDKLATEPTLPTFALLTDLGNDIAYGVSPGELIG